MILKNFEFLIYRNNFKMFLSRNRPDFLIFFPWAQHHEWPGLQRLFSRQTTRGGCLAHTSGTETIKLSTSGLFSQGAVRRLIQKKSNSHTGASDQYLGSGKLWSPQEVELFDRGMNEHRKDFFVISKMVRTCISVLLKFVTALLEKLDGICFACECFINAGDILVVFIIGLFCFWAQIDRREQCSRSPLVRRYFDYISAQRP